MRVLVLNAGSSSLKASVVAVAEGTEGSGPAAASIDLGADATRQRDVARAVREAIDVAAATIGRGAIDAVGHRVVHGGSRFRDAVRVDDDVLRGIEEMVRLAPLHNGVALAVIRAAMQELPEAPHVAAFDTAFHATLPPEAYVYPAPHHWYEEWGIRRYGFHGLSVEWSVQRASELLARPIADLALVVAHLGSGCSVTAVDGGRSVDTSMGYTPLEGLMMGTRSGSIDPGVLLRLLAERRLGARAMADALDHRSGLLGVSGLDGGMKEIALAADKGHERAALAVAIFTRRAAAGIAAAATALDRVDALVFTGGIGAHATSVRRSILDRLTVLGLSRDDDPEPDVAADRRVLVVEAREDRVIAAAAATLLAASSEA